MHATEIAETSQMDDLKIASSTELNTSEWQ